jgi:transcriptional regulator with XRE-family HTH domain
VTATHPGREDEAALGGIGDRIREERTQAGISQRELARRLGLSASMISQIESGQTLPSVATLWAIVTELDLSLDTVIRGEEPDAVQDDGPDAGNGGPVVRADRRRSVRLDTGVRWEELSPGAEEGIDFVRATYEVGGASTTDESLMRHSGREYGYVLSGLLGIQIGFREYELGPGDSIAFDSTTPHRLFNKGDVPVEAVWFVAGRHEHDNG